MRTDGRRRITEAASTRRASTISMVQRSMLHLLLLAVKLLSDLPNELALWPAQPLIVDRHCKQSLFSPTVLFDLLGRTPFAAISSWHPPHRVTSGSSAA